jgi:predicted O-methyltransferase YrrM
LAQRYAQLDAEIERAMPSRIVEIGTWNGARAEQMIAAALKHRPHVEYTGFDLFETATPETDEAESNVKRHHSAVEVQGRLDAYAFGKAIAIHLVKGNTRDTLAAHRFYPDFAFIDGGHSIATIASDYGALAQCPRIVLDDFYTPDDQGRGIDPMRFGCNTLVQALALRGEVKVEILPVKDPVRGGGFVQMVAVRR